MPSAQVINFSLPSRSSPCPASLSAPYQGSFHTVKTISPFPCPPPSNSSSWRWRIGKKLIETCLPPPLLSHPVTPHICSQPLSLISRITLYVFCPLFKRTGVFTDSSLSPSGWMEIQEREIGLIRQVILISERETWSLFTISWLGPAHTHTLKRWGEQRQTKSLTFGTAGD